MQTFAFTFLFSMLMWLNTKSLALSMAAFHNHISFILQEFPNVPSLHLQIVEQTSEGAARSTDRNPSNTRYQELVQQYRSNICSCEYLQTAAWLKLTHFTVKDCKSESRAAAYVHKVRVCNSNTPDYRCKYETVTTCVILLRDPIPQPHAFLILKCWLYHLCSPGIIRETFRVPFFTWQAACGVNNVGGLQH